MWNDMTWRTSAAKNIIGEQKFVRRHPNTHTQTTKVISQGIDSLCASDPFGSSFVIVTVDESICSRVFFFFFNYRYPPRFFCVQLFWSTLSSILLTQCSEKDQLVNEAVAGGSLSPSLRGVRTRAISLWERDLYYEKKKRVVMRRNLFTAFAAKFSSQKRIYILFLALKRFRITHHHASCFLISIPSWQWHNHNLLFIISKRQISKYPSK